MFTPIKQIVAKGLSGLAAFAFLLITLPLTLGMMLLVLIGGVLTMATLRHRMNSTGYTGPARRGQPHSETSQSDSPLKPPIEGSYTVIDK